MPVFIQVLYAPEEKEKYAPLEQEIAVFDDSFFSTAPSFTCQHRNLSSRENSHTIQREVREMEVVLTGVVVVK